MILMYVNWVQFQEDMHFPRLLIQDMLFGLLHHVGERFLNCWPFSKIRQMAIEAAINQIRYENENSKYLCYGIADKVFGLLSRWVDDPNSKAYKLHLARIPDYLWVAEDGLKVKVFGSQSWDAAFAIQAIVGCNVSEDYGPTLKKAHHFLKSSQVVENPSGDFRAMYRHISKGAWTFSIQDEGWQVSDCTAEALKATLLLSQMPTALVGEKMETERFYDAVNVILSLQVRIYVFLFLNITCTRSQFQLKSHLNLISI
ncbi:putative lupeol synthase [Medicago truncatula]|uniref:Putative lupeol synthase n=1 Tax=Medicago truncatula TaxID=3880 RepID=A0A396HCQ5_MEDTR|nr:putative lupeol synthase [Medicago truncatula]